MLSAAVYFQRQKFGVFPKADFAVPKKAKNDRETKVANTVAKRGFSFYV